MINSQAKIEKNVKFKTSNVSSSYLSIGYLSIANIMAFPIIESTIRKFKTYDFAIFKQNLNHEFYYALTINRFLVI